MCFSETEEIKSVRCYCDRIESEIKAVDTVPGGAG